jgi:hypothetical protein
MTGVRAAGFAAAAVLLSGILAAQVRVTCYVEPQYQLKKAKQLGCDFKNEGAQPVVLSASDVRDASFEKLGSPLRWSAADYVVENSEKRSPWATVFTVLKWAGVAASFAQGLNFIKFDDGDNWKYLIPTATGAMQTIDSVGRGEHNPMTMPPDYLPEGDFILDGFEARSYVLIAAEPLFASSFRVHLNGRVMSALGAGGTGGRARGFAARAGRRYQAVEWSDLERMNREALERINEWVFEVADDRVYELQDFTAYPTNNTRTEGGSRFAVPQVAQVKTLVSFPAVAAKGNLQAEPVKGVEVTDRGGAAAFQSIGESPLPLSLNRVLVNAGRDAGAFTDWVAVGQMTARNGEVLGR